MTPFAAVLLAGGRSRRMGSDKALLPLPDGRLLWERQWETLRALEPAALFISGPRRDEFPSGIVCLTDTTPGHGPLGGVATALEATGSLPLLLVLAVDLPAMTADYLRTLLAQSSPGQGVAPWHADTRFYEPLAAVYPAGVLPVARLLLKGDNWSMQKFVRAAGASLNAKEITAAEGGLFRNWNHPDNCTTR